MEQEIFTLNKQREPNLSFLGLLIVLGSYIFLFAYIGWIFSDFLPLPIAELYPSNTYRIVVPSLVIGTYSIYLLFNWVSWKIEVSKVAESKKQNKNNDPLNKND